MGVLDEAIKEHLELKRRRGADAGEIQREEDEALGEVRVTRGPGTRSTGADAEAEAEQEAQAPHTEDDLSSMHQPTEAFDTAEVAAALGQAPEEETEQQSVAEPQHEADPERDEGPAAPTEEPVAEEETTEEEPAEADETPDPADELEETPEFLEDAPEHDKLWFEQKPPKDFDF